MSIFKRLMCNHNNIEFVSNIYNKSKYRCKECGKILYCDDYNHRSNYFNTTIAKDRRLKIIKNDNDNATKGKFIVIEGPDGIGKTTTIELLKDKFKNNDNVVFLNDPSTLPEIEPIRKLVKTMNVSPTTDLFLFLAARKELNSIILDYLIKGKIIICDRYTLSTLVYQGQLIDIRKILDTIMIHNVHIRPDLLILLDAEKPFRVSKEDRLESRYSDYNILRDLYKDYSSIGFGDNNEFSLFPYMSIINVDDKSPNEVLDNVCDKIDMYCKNNMDIKISNKL